MGKMLMSKVGLSVVLSAATMLASVSASAGNLPAIDSVVTTTFDKSVIHGSLAHKCADGTVDATCSGPLDYDGAGNARFIYSGQIFAVGTNNQTGELTTLANQIGSITGEAAFPPAFVGMSAYVNSKMDEMMSVAMAGGDPSTVQMGQFPPIVPWTCNHCDMTVAGKHYVSIVDVLDPANPLGLDSNVVSAIQANFNNNVQGGASAALDAMRMDGRAFTGVGPASFDPSTKSMGVRMAGCSALVNLTDMKIGTLCMNATAVFNVGAAQLVDSNDPSQGYTQSSQISADGSSNCVTVMQPMK